jgi:hypothetical protein
MILAGIGITVAGVFLWRRDLDKAFVAAALGMVAWLLNYRAHMKAIIVTLDRDVENKRDGLENVDEQDNNYDR